MSRLTRRSASQQLSQRPSISENVVNCSSDGAIDSKRNSQWWKNLSETSRRSSILKRNSAVLNVDSSVTESENTLWWKNLSASGSVPLPKKLHSTGEYKKDDSRTNRILSESESDDNNEIFPNKTLFGSQEPRSQKGRYSKAFHLNTEKVNEEESVRPSEEQIFTGEESKENEGSTDKNLSRSESDDKEEVFPKKSLFGTQELRSQKSRYSRAFHLYNEKAIEDEPVHPSEEQNFEIEELQNQLDDDNKLTESPTSNETKKNKKSKKTKSLFLKKHIKRKFSDAFVVTDNEPAETEQANAGKLVEVGLIKTNLKNKKYSDSLARSEIKDQDNSESSDKEIIIEEIQTQKDASYVSNPSLNVTKGTKTKFHKTIEKSSQKEILNTETTNTSKTNLLKSNSKHKNPIRNNRDDSESSDADIVIEEVRTQEEAAEASVTKGMEKDLSKGETTNTSQASLLKSNSKNKKTIRQDRTDSESSDAEIFIEDVRTQKEVAEASVTKGMKKDLSKRDTRTKNKKHSEAILGPSSSKILQENDGENKIDKMKQNYTRHIKDSQISSKEKDESSDEENFEEEVVEQSINITKGVKKNLFKRVTKSRKFSQTLLDPSTSKVAEVVEQENDVHEDNDAIFSVQHEDESLFTVQHKNKEFSQVPASIFESDENKENNRADFGKENVAMENKEIITDKKNSQEFLEFIGIQKSFEDKGKVAASKHVEENDAFVNKSITESGQKEKSDNDTTFSSIATIDFSEASKHPLFPLARKSLYSAKYVTKKIEHSEVLSDIQPQQHLEKSKAQRISAKRLSLRSTSPTESISNFFDGSLISSTKLFINPNENKDTGSEGSVKKKRRRLPKSMSVVHDNSVNISEVNIQKLQDSKDIESEDALKYKNSTPKKRRKSKSSSKSLSILMENPENISDNQNQMIEENKNLNSTPKRDQKPTPVAKDQENLVNISNNKMQQINDSDSEPEELKKSTNLKGGRKPKSITKVSEDNDSELDELFRNRSFSQKKGRKSKAITKVPEETEWNKFENEKNEDKHFETSLLVKNVSSRIGRKPKSVTRTADDFHENILTTNSESNDVVHNKKKSRLSKVISTVSENLDNVENIDTGNKDIEPENSIKKKNLIINRTRKSSIRTDAYYDNELEGNEDEDVHVRNKYSKTRKSSISEISEISAQVHKKSATYEINQVDKQLKHKKIVSKIPKKVKTTSNVQKQDISKTFNNNNMLDKDIDIDSGETVKRQILPNSSTRKSKYITNVESHENSNSEDEILDVPEKSRTPAQSLIENQRQSSKFIVEGKLGAESVSDIVTINSTRARSSQFSKTNNTRDQNIEAWLSKSIKYAEPEQENRTENRHSNLNMKPSVKRIGIFRELQHEAESDDSETRELRKKLLLKAAKTISPEKQSKPQPQISSKKITDYFTTQNNIEKLKSIQTTQKKTNGVKKKRPVCTARLINGKPYYSKKLYSGKYWCSPHLYKLLQNKIKNEYGDDTINESEKIMKFMAESVQTVIKSKKHLMEEVDNLKKVLAKYKIITTTNDFFNFCMDNLPAEYIDLTVPFTRMGKSEPTVPYNKEDVWKPIMF